MSSACPRAAPCSRACSRSPAVCMTTASTLTNLSPQTASLDRYLARAMTPASSAKRIFRATTPTATNPLAAARTSPARICLPMIGMAPTWASIKSSSCSSVTTTGYLNAPLAACITSAGTTLMAKAISRINSTNERSHPSPMPRKRTTAHYPRHGTTAPGSVTAPSTFCASRPVYNATQAKPPHSPSRSAPGSPWRIRITPLMRLHRGAGCIDLRTLTYPSTDAEILTKSPGGIAHR